MTNIGFDVYPPGASDNKGDSTSTPGTPAIDGYSNLHEEAYAFGDKNRTTANSVDNYWNMNNNWDLSKEEFRLTTDSDGKIHSFNSGDNSDESKGLKEPDTKAEKRVINSIKEAFLKIGKEVSQEDIKNISKDAERAFLKACKNYFEKNSKAPTEKEIDKISEKAYIDAMKKNGIKINEEEMQYVAGEITKSLKKPIEDPNELMKSLAEEMLEDLLQKIETPMERAITALNRLALANETKLGQDNARKEVTNALKKALPNEGRDYSQKQLDKMADDAAEKFSKAYDRGKDKPITDKQLKKMAKKAIKAAMKKNGVRLPKKELNKVVKKALQALIESENDLPVIPGGGGGGAGGPDLRNRDNSFDSFRKKRHGIKNIWSPDTNRVNYPRDLLEAINWR